MLLSQILRKITSKRTRDTCIMHTSIFYLEIFMQYIFMIFLHITCAYGSCVSDWITDYQAKQTINESPTGEKMAKDLFVSFKAHEFAPFFETVTSQANKELASTPDLSTSLPQQALEKSFFKLRGSIVQFCKRYPRSAIATKLKSWNDFHFSKEDKETVSFFAELEKKNKNLSLSPLEENLWETLQHAEKMKAFWKNNPHLFSPFYQKHGEYLIDLYTHKKMSQAFAHKFQPALFHHVENFLAIAQKKAAFLYEDDLLQQFFAGHLKLTSSIELKAKKSLGPLFHTMMLYASSNVATSKETIKNFSFCPILLNISDGKNDEPT